jgi:hypothetical protein
MPIDDDEWWAGLAATRKASIRRWLTGGDKPPPSPEELGLEPILDEALQPRAEAMPG